MPLSRDLIRLAKTVLIAVSVFMFAQYVVRTRLGSSSSLFSSSSSQQTLRAASSSATKPFSAPVSPPATMSAKSQIEQAIAAAGKHGVNVFSKSYCPYCKKAKSLLTSLSVNAKVFELDQMDDGVDWQAYLADKTGQRTVPMIFVGSTFIGGSSDLEAKNNNGELARLLSA